MELEKVIAVRTAKTVYRKGTLVIKLFDMNYAKSDILNEALNQARMEETSMNVPKVVEVTKIDGKWAIISQYIEGKTLDRLMKDNPDQQREYLELFVDIQLQMHRLKSPMFIHLSDKMITKIQQTDLNASLRYDLFTRLSTIPKHNHTCHGDFNPSNIILTADRQAYTLDWSHATLGDALGDAAKTYLIFQMNGQFETAENYLQYYCKKSGSDSSDIKRWLPIVAAAQLVPKHGLPKNPELFMKWINTTTI